MRLQVKELYNMPEVSQHDLHTEREEIKRLQQMEEQLLAKKTAQVPAGDAMFRQQAGILASKKMQAQVSLSALLPLPQCRRRCPSPPSSLSPSPINT
jgi:formate dehydrogenase maturation protein FdhE